MSYLLIDGHPSIPPLKRAISVTCVFLILFSFGCAGLLSGNYGKIVPDGNVTQAFENYQVSPGLNYYISGSAVRPNAIIGIDKNSILSSKLWKKIELTPPILKDLVESMKDEVYILHGFNILDNKGNDIGDWYSILSARTLVKIEEDNKVIVFTPDIDIYEKNGDQEKQDRE